MLKEVISSWEVIAVTVALFLFLKIVFYAAQAYHRPRMLKKISFKRKKPKQENDIAAPSAKTDSSDELGLDDA